MDLDDSDDACKDFGSSFFIFQFLYFLIAITGLVSSDPSDKMDFSGTSFFLTNKKI